MARLVKITEQPGPANFPLRSPRVIIGRDGDADLVVAHGSLSRRHAEVVLDGDTLTLTDLGSKNGTRVNDMVLKGSVNIAPGDHLQLGDVVYRVDADSWDIPGTSEIDPEATWTEDHASGIGDLSALIRAPDEATRLRVVLRLTEEFARPMSIDQILRRVLEFISLVLAADRLTVLRLHDANLETVASVEAGVPTPGRRPYSNAISRIVLERGVAMRFADIRGDSRLAKVASVMEQDIRCAICAPLVHRGQVFGVLYADSLAAARAFDDDDLRMMVAVANQAALAMHHAILRDELENRAVMETRLLRFFPPKTARRLLDQGHAELEPQKLDVTVLFADIAGFTQLSSTLEPVRVLNLLNTYFPAMVTAIQAEEGTLEKYIGDAIMAVWGAPFPQDDGADRALRAALSMQGAMRDVNAALSAKGLPEIAIYIGLHTGPVAFGNVGTQDYLQFATVGVTTNVAARVCAATASGQVWLTEQTREALHGAFDLVPMADTLVKGKAEPLKLFRADRDIVHEGGLVSFKTTPDDDD